MCIDVSELHKTSRSDDFATLKLREVFGQAEFFLPFGSCVVKIKSDREKHISYLRVLSGLWKYEKEKLIFDEMIRDWTFDIKEK